jgi:hypothetical protein
MPTTIAPAWTADWLNAWLATIGAALLVPDLRVAWSTALRPTAVLSHPTRDPLDAIGDAFPTGDAVASLAVARDLPGLPELPRNVTRDAYRARAALGRTDGTLGATLTDLAPSDEKPVVDWRLNPPAPKGLTIGQRVDTVRQAIPEPHPALDQSIVGAVRIPGNGLGFDVRRLTLPTDPVGGNWVDPVVELLAFVGLCLVPLRGNGKSATTRISPATGPLRWPTWTEPLTATGIDTFLDRATIDRTLADVWFESRGYQTINSSDPTRGYGSTRV